jgi:hypothetical protein
MIDDSGMRVSGNRNDFRNWSSLPVTQNTWHEANWFATTHSPGPWAILDLGSVCDLETISIWSCNPGENVPYRRSVTKLDVYVRKNQDRNNTHLFSRVSTETAERPDTSRGRLQPVSRCLPQCESVWSGASDTAVTNRYFIQ